MQLSTWRLLGDILLWLSIFLLHAIEFKATHLSTFELSRRAKSGDSDAKKIDIREKLMPRLQTLRRIFEAVLIVLATVLTVVTFGWVVGTIIASILSLISSTVAGLRPTTRIARMFYQPREARLLTIVEEWPWLDRFNEVTNNSNATIAHSKAELQHIIEQSASVLSRDELLRLQASMMLDTHTVSDVMTPVSVVETADVHDALGPLVLDDLHKTGHSRFPVIEADLNHVVGVLYLHDIINLKSSKSSVREAMDSRVHYIHENQSLEHALHGFLRTHRHLFVVVNDYRETVGIVTLEDVLETLLGKKIVDEFDKFEDLRAVAQSNPRNNNLPKGKTDI